MESSMNKKFFVRRCKDGALALMMTGWIDKEDTNTKPVPLVVTVRTGTHKRKVRKELQEMANEFNLILEVGMVYVLKERLEG